jgi:hypothetical protein
MTWYTFCGYLRFFYPALLGTLTINPVILMTRLFILTALVLLSSCDKTEVIGPRASLPVHDRNDKPRTPLAIGTIRGYFNDDYKILTDHIEKVQPIDSFSNCYFYGSCNNSDLKQINLIRCDDEFIAAIYINGLSPDSLPLELPVSQQFGRSAEIQFYSFGNWNSTSAGFYYLNNFYGVNVFITDVTDDVLTGTFEGLLGSSSSGSIWVRDGEFKIKIFRKHISCGK